VRRSVQVGVPVLRDKKVVSSVFVPFVHRFTGDLDTILRLNETGRRYHLKRRRCWSA
jgi:hypothetical protein